MCYARSRPLKITFKFLISSMTSVFTKVKVPTVGFLKIFIGGTLNLDDNLSSNPNQLNKVKWESRMKIKQKHSINHLFHFNLKFKHFYPNWIIIMEPYLLIIGVVRTDSTVKCKKLLNWTEVYAGSENQFQYTVAKKVSELK